MLPQEAMALRTLPTEEQSNQFLSIWTLKEAYAKTLGKGLSLPLDWVAFQIKEGAIKMKPEDGTGWWFSLLCPTDEHWLALAARPVRLDLRWLVPLTNLTHASKPPIVAATRLLPS